MAKKKYPGVLSKKSRREPIGLLMRDDHKHRLIQNHANEDYRNLKLLAAHYGIDESEDMWFWLALALASEHVPAFQEAQTVGRKPKWTGYRKGLLVVEIERKKSSKKRSSVRWAAAQLAKCEPWRSFLETRESREYDLTSDPAEVLRTTYQHFKNDEWAIVWRKAFKYHEVQGTLAHWDAQVAEAFVRNPESD